MRSNTAALGEALIDEPGGQGLERVVRHPAVAPRDWYFAVHVADGRGRRERVLHERRALAATRPLDQAAHGAVFYRLDVLTVDALGVDANARARALPPPASETVAGEILARARAFGVHAESVDGQDVQAVNRTMGRLVERARRGEGPAFLECKTYRYYGHHVGDVNREYRSRDEERDWMTHHDPLETLSPGSSTRVSPSRRCSTASWPT